MTADKPKSAPENMNVHWRKFKNYAQTKREFKILILI